MRLLLCFLLSSSFLLAGSNGSEWKPFANTFLSFQMPNTPEEESRQDGVRLWKTEAEGTYYCVATKPRKCSTGQASLKACDVGALVRELKPQNSKLLNSKTDENDIWRFVFTDFAGAFYQISVCANGETLAALMTKTASKESPNHQKLLESFTFLK